MTVFSRALAWFWLLLVPTPFLVRADAPKADPEVLAKFAVAKNGDALLLPLTVQEKKYLFVLDTGSSISLFDPAVPVGEHLDTIKAETPHGLKEIKIHKPPQALVGTLPLETKGFVAVHDLAKLRQVSGHDIHGVVGMDFLSRHIVHIDFDEGLVRILKKVPPKAGTPLVLTFERGLPHLAVRMASLKETPFLLDSGYVGLGSGHVKADLLEALLAKKEITIVGTSLSETLSGTKTERIGRGGKLSCADFAVDQAVLGEGKHNSLNMSFLARFAVTFDFPQEKIYLNKGKRYNQPDLWNVSGLHVLRLNGKTVVHSVDKDSPAAAAGVKGGDQILIVGERKADGLSMFELRRLCCIKGSTLNLTLKRAAETVIAKVPLK
jgi:hypothetical protein